MHYPLCEQADRPPRYPNGSVAAPGSPVNSFHNGPQLQPPPLTPPITGKHKFFNQEFEASLKRRTAVNQPRHEHTPNLLRQPTALFQFNPLQLKIVLLNPFLVGCSFSWCSQGQRGQSILFTVVFTLPPPATIAVFASCLSSLYS